jgi:hypothetical protein
VDWFGDLVSEFVIKTNSKTKRRHLELPGKQEILSSAQLLKLDYQRHEYEGLKLMLKTCSQEFR